MIAGWVPMLAAALRKPTTTDEEFRLRVRTLRFPFLVTPKLDGIRAITSDDVPGLGEQCVPLARSLKMIPNKYIFQRMARELPPGLDGELITYPVADLFAPEAPARNFYQIQSDVTTHGGQPNFKYHVFDIDIFDLGKKTYEDRVRMLRECDELPDWCVKLLPERAENMAQLQSIMDRYVEQGYEGCCFRTPNSPYRFWRGGRSTLKEQWLIKWKVFEPGEGEIIGFEEEMHNANVATTGLLGQTERSSHQANMVGKGRLGALVVKWNCPQGYVKVGSGFCVSQRVDLWARRDEIKGEFCHFKYQPFGTKDAPRTPIFLGIRKRITM